MKDFGRVRSVDRPQEIEITSTSVFIASNINPYTEIIEEKTYTGYEYDYKQYSKDEYISLLTEENAAAIAELQEELAATKILLGVE